MANSLEFLIRARDQTSQAILSAKAGLGSIADASGKATGSLDRFLKLSPQMIAIGVATAGVGAAFRTLYGASAELQGSASKLGEAWDRAVISIGNYYGLTKAGGAVDWLTDKINNYAKVVNGVNRPLPMSDKEWTDIQKRSNEAFDAIKKQEKEKKELAEKTEKDRIALANKTRDEYQKVWQGALTDEQKLSLEYNKDVNAAVEYMKQQPQEKANVIATLLALEEQYQQKLRGLKEKAFVGPDAPDFAELEKARKALNDTFVGPRPEGDDETKKRREALRDSLDEDRALQMSYGDYMVLLYQDNEREKTDTLRKEEALRRDIQQTAFKNTSSILGSLAILADGHGRKAFKRSQRLARAQAAVDAISAAISAAKDTPGGPWAKFAAYAAVALNFGARMKQINSVSYDGGGGDTSGGGGGGSPTATTNSSTPSGVPVQNQSQQLPQVTIIVQGNVLDGTQFRQMVNKTMTDIFDSEGMPIRSGTAQFRALTA